MLEELIRCFIDVTVTLHIVFCLMDLFSWVPLLLSPLKECPGWKNMQFNKVNHYSANYTLIFQDDLILFISLI